MEEDRKNELSLTYVNNMIEKNESIKKILESNKCCILDDFFELDIQAWTVLFEYDNEKYSIIIYRNKQGNSKKIFMYDSDNNKMMDLKFESSLITILEDPDIGIKTIIKTHRENKNSK